MLDQRRNREFVLPMSGKKNSHSQPKRPFTFRQAAEPSPTGNGETDKLTFDTWATNGLEVFVLATKASLRSQHGSVLSKAVLRVPSYPIVQGRVRS